MCAVFALSGAASAGGATFPAKTTSLGPIPDATSPVCGSFGASRAVTFAATGLKNQITNVEVGFMLNPQHSWGADLDVVLIAPGGAAHTVFSRTGATVATGCGDSSDVHGPYLFSDLASAPPSGGWWEAATAAGAAAAIPAGIYRTTAPGGAGAVNPSPATLMTPAFGATNPNGVWTLRFRDGGQGDAATVSAASLTVSAIDTRPPQTWFLRKPAQRTTSRRVTFKFRSNESGAIFQCKLGRNAYKRCISPRTFTVSLGSHTLRVRAIDQAGNRDATPATYTWRVVRG